MRAVVQRVRSSEVCIDGETVGKIGKGSLVLLGVEQGDTERDLRYLYEKVVHLRIFEDEQGKMNLSLLDIGGAMLVVSQFTLLGDCRKGRRPSFVNAEAPELASRWCDRFVEAVAGQGVHVETGRFGADMQVSLVNDGPVTILLDSRDL